MKSYYVYIMASQGVTNDLLRRAYEHKQNLLEGFTKEHSVHMLVWYEAGNSVEGAILQEKQIKKWNRAWKLRLIEGMNP